MNLLLPHLAYKCKATPRSLIAHRRLSGRLVVLILGEHSEVKDGVSIHKKFGLFIIARMCVCRHVCMCVFLLTSPGDDVISYPLADFIRDELGLITWGRAPGMASYRRSYVAIIAFYINGSRGHCVF